MLALLTLKVYRKCRVLILHFLFLSELVFIFTFEIVINYDLFLM